MHMTFHFFETIQLLRKHCDSRFCTINVHFVLLLRDLDLDLSSKLYVSDFFQNQETQVQ